MATPTFDMLARFTATGVLNSLVEATVIAIAAWALLRLSRQNNSRARFAVWFATLLLAVILPWLGAPASSPTQGSGHSAGVGIILPSCWASAIFWLWAAGASLALLRVGFAFWQLLRLRWHCHPLAADHLPPAVLQGVLSNFRRAEVRLSDNLRIPTAVGFFRPLIVIPSWALEELSPEELNSVLLHELEHLRRWDDWTNLAQKIVKAVLFFHPAVWWIENRLTLEREMACDDIVLAQTASPKVYASSLISFAEKLQSARGLALAQALVSRMHQMSLRVAQILDAKRPKHIGIWKPAVGLTTALLIIVFGAAPFMPRFVAFETRPSHIPNGGAETPTADSGNAFDTARGREQQVALRQNSVAPVRAIPATFHPPASARRSLNSRGLNMSQANLNALRNLKKVEVRAPSIMQASATRELPVPQRAIGDAAGGSVDGAGCGGRDHWIS